MIRFLVCVIVLVGCGSSAPIMEPDSGLPEQDGQVELQQDLELYDQQVVPDQRPADQGEEQDSFQTQGDLGIKPDLIPVVPDSSPSPDTSSPDLSQLQPDASPLPDISLPDASPLPDFSPLPDTIPSNGIEWVKINGGSYMMGQPPTSACTTPGCTGQTQVYVGSFLLTKYEITKQQRSALFGPQPWTPCADSRACPATQVNWISAVKACNALSVKEGFEECYYCFGYTCTPTGIPKCGYRLPTRAEFEYAYRAGTTTEFYNGLADPTKCVGATKAALIAWYDWNSSGNENFIGQKEPNAWGLYDMAGNVEEWTLDDCTDSGNPGKIVMGGHYGSPSMSTQAGAYRCSRIDLPTPLTGFRCARSL